MSSRAVDVLVVGAGPSGLAAATELRRRGVARVLVVERESAAGGVPRHSDHIGFGVREFRRVLSGPQFAERSLQRALQVGVDVKLNTSATEWLGPTSLRTVSSAGIIDVTADAVVLATGCRERPRSARLVPGTRAPGVMTTGTLQQLVYVERQRLRGRAVVVGAEHVSFSAILTLAHAGARPVAMVTPHPCHQSYLPFQLLTTTPHRVPILTHTALTTILGRDRVEGVELTNVNTGARRRLSCELVVFTGDWVPDNEVARLGSLLIDPNNRSPYVDGSQRTSRPGVFAVGNLLHGAETAEAAAECGRFVAASVRSFLASGCWSSPTVLRCEDPIRWVSPGTLAPGDVRLPHNRLITRVTHLLPSARIEVWQDRTLLWVGRRRRLVPERPIHLPTPWLRHDLSCAPITLRVG